MLEIFRHLFACEVRRLEGAYRNDRPAGAGFAHLGELARRIVGIADRQDARLFVGDDGIAGVEQSFGDASRAHEFSEKLPLGRPASVPELTELFVFLASPHSAYTSGVVFTVDGGIAAAKSVI